MRLYVLYDTEPVDPREPLLIELCGTKLDATYRRTILITSEARAGLRAEHLKLTSIEVPTTKLPLLRWVNQLLACSDLETLETFLNAYQPPQASA